jgi:hypothetical protein
LKRYASIQPELLMSAARFAASAYEARKDDEKICAEALFCYIVAGDRLSFNRLLNELLERVSTSEYSLSIDNLLQLQEETKKFSFVKFFPATNAAPGVINIDMLINAYEAVRAGLVKDPKTIRDYARHFEAVANDPSIHFDAARAAQNLYQRAMLYERMNEGKGPISGVPVPPDVIEAVARLHLYIDKELSVEEIAIVQQTLLNHPEIESRFHFDMKIKHLIHERCAIERAPAHLREAVLRLARMPAGRATKLDPELEMELRAEFNEISESM